MTTVDTVFYAASMLNIPKRLDLSGNGGDGASLSAPNLALQRVFGDLGARFKEHDITLDAFHAAFGNEAGLHLDWPADEAQPTLIVSLEVRDPAAAGKFVDRFTAAISSDDNWETSEVDGLTLHSADIPNVPSISPTLAVTSKHLLFGLNSPEVQEAAKREKTPAPNFTSSGDYKTASGTVEKPNTVFAYLDTKTFFERLYGTLKPYAMTASFLLPQASDYVDFGKLPEADSIAKHLSPTVVSQTYNPEGCLLESVGSVTFGQATAVIVGGAVGAAAPFLPKQNGDEVQAIPPADAPMATP